MTITTPDTLLTDADLQRRAALRRMKVLATALLVVAAVVFAVAFGLQDQYPWLGYVRAAAEGAMVGALADWFAVTALFRHPLGLRIPHTAIIPNRKDEIGVSLGEFVEQNFLSDEVVRSKLATFSIADRLGTWLADPKNAERASAEGAVVAQGVLRFLSDADVERLIERLARTHLFDREWAPTIGRVGAELVAAGQQRAVVDALVEATETWLTEHPDALGEVVSTRLPRWVPGFAKGLADERAHKELIGVLRAVRDDPEHPLRVAIDGYLVDLTERLQHDPAMAERVEEIKASLLESERMRTFAGRVWEAVKATLTSALADPASELRVGAASALVDVGVRLSADRALSAKIDAWIADAAGYAVQKYRHDLASVISETVQRWDARETTQKIELQVGRDLQFIRINGTVVGAIAGLAIYAIATGVHAVVG
ncbi:DUF445 domain-containing protein [Herbiconiux sp. KACC 21604]|uniref:DUF445 domain-containing protein n=1 Tax=unclassified Herbiconiux TaxID=2618217 RepID=UPI001491F61E|nr:DUF445 domain-containing protein [Herbiconiux sp. SALV-R1]QJU52708.1 DUF445 domain-containing protein [Herbiconiux sp. SALV-R1]WPO87607.1 DUF445 domain-containing protein [Herbiconiux sp. KACC 21604]